MAPHLVGIDDVGIDNFGIGDLGMDDVRPDGPLLLAARGGDYPAVATVCQYYHRRLMEYARSAGVDDPESVVGHAVTVGLLALDPEVDPAATGLVPEFERDLFLRIVAEAGLDAVATAEIDLAGADLALATVADPAGPEPAVEAGPGGPGMALEAGPVDWSDLGPVSVAPSPAAVERLRRLGIGVVVTGCAIGVAVVGYLLVGSDGEDGSTVEVEGDEVALPAQTIDGAGEEADDGSGRIQSGGSTDGDQERSTVTVAVDDPAGLRDPNGALPVATSSQADLPTSAEPDESTPATTARSTTATSGSEGSQTTAGRSTTSASTPTSASATTGSGPTSTTQPLSTTAPSPITPPGAGGPGAYPPAATGPVVGDYSGQTLDSTAFRAADGEDLTGYDFNGATLTNVTFEAVDLSGVSFAGATLVNVTIVRSNLTGADFSNTRLDFVNFSSSDVSGVDFAGATITNGSVNGYWSPDNPPINLPWTGGPGWWWG